MDYGTKLPLLDYQREGVDFLISKGRALLADEMGLGKTVQAISAAMILKQQGKVKRVLVVCPSSLKRQWRTEIEKFTDETATIPEGQPKRRKAQYDNDTFFTIVNYELVYRDYHTIYPKNWELVILDETQRIKNWKTKTSRYIKGLTPPYRFALTGTPIENRLEELHSILSFIDQKILGPFWVFSDDYIVWKTKFFGPTPVKVVDGYKNLERLRERISRVLLRRKKIDVLPQLPPLVQNTYRVEMIPAQRKIYKKVEQEIVAFINDKGERKVINEVLGRITYLREICDSPKLLSSDADMGKKVPELLKIIDDTVQAGRQIIVFTQWTRMMEIIQGELDAQKLKYTVLHGGLTNESRQESIDRFTAGEVPIFLSTDAGAYGVNLQVASVVVNFDLPWNPAVLEQRIARAHRMGVEDSVTVINLITQDSIEERMLNIINSKRWIARAVLDNEDAELIPESTWSQIKEVMGI